MLQNSNTNNKIDGSDKIFAITLNHNVLQTSNRNNEIEGLDKQHTRVTNTI